MRKSPGSRALWRSGLFSLCAGALISLVLLRFLSQLDQPGLTPEDLRRSGAALALQILSISAAAIGFVTYTSLRTRSSLEQALTALTESCRIFRSAARAAGAMVFCRKAPGPPEPGGDRRLGQSCPAGGFSSVAGGDPL